MKAKRIGRKPSGAAKKLAMYRVSRSQSGTAAERAAAAAKSAHNKRGKC